jgi:hypothetical protein
MNLHKTPQKGGSRPGAGRPKIDATERVEGKLSPQDKAKFFELGGFVWLRKVLKEYRVNT